MRFAGTLLSLVIASSAVAQSTENPMVPEPLPQESTEAPPLMPRWYGGVNYSLLDLLIPSKYGLTVGYSDLGRHLYEIEYMRGAVSVPLVIDNLGSAVEQRASFLVRRFGEQGSFNFFYGASYVSFDLDVGSRRLQELTGNTVRRYKVVEVDTLGAHFGIGNRWAFENGVVLGCDWFSWAQPIIVTKKRTPILDGISDADERWAVKKTISWIAYFPRYTLLKLQLGLNF